jgi:hypothetical protein
MDSRRLILVEDNGDFRAFVGQARSSLRDFVGRYRPIASSPQLLILRRDARARDDGADGRILMAGEIPYPNTVLEVVNIIAASRWAGILHVFGGESHRTLGLDKGALRFAQSDDPEDRLNKVLFRMGVVTPAQSESMERGPKSDQRFGEGLVEHGLVSRQELFGYLQRQMAEIFFSSLLERAGCYAFLVADGAETVPSMITHLPLQQLLFDAAERLDRMTEFEKLIPDEALCPVVEPGVEMAELEPRLRRVVGSCDGSRSVREIAVETWLGRYETMAAIFELVRRDQVRLLPARRDLRETAARLAEPFNDALRAIFEAVDRNGDPKRTRGELDEWIAAGGFREYLAGALDERGMVDPAHVAQLLEQLKVRDRVEVVEHALHEMISFALFAASLSLPREKERELSRRVQERLRPG